MADIAMIIHQCKYEHQGFNAIFFAVCNDHFWSRMRIGDEYWVKFAWLCEPYGTDLLTGALHVSANFLHLLTLVLHVFAIHIDLLTGGFHI